MFARTEPDRPSQVLRPYGFFANQEGTMGRRSVRPRRAGHARDCASELEGLLVPEAVFSDPFEVVSHESLSGDEKRAILARWLARVCGREAAARLKWTPTPPDPAVCFDDVMDALRALENDNGTPTRRGGARAARPKLHRPVGSLH